MTAQEQKLCDRCHERPATCHICCGNTGETKDLCETCYQESASPLELASTKQFRETVRKGKCKYCGQPAVGGSGGFIPVLGEQLFLWCEKCRLDLVEFYQRPENALPGDYPFDDKAAQERVSQQFAERERRQEEYMRQRVSERRSKNDG